MGLELYQEIAALDASRLNLQFLGRLKRCLESWRDTSIPKRTRLEEMQVAQEICELFTQHMRSDMPETEAKILFGIFSGISKNVLLAVSGLPVKFDDAVAALDLIINNIKE